jgi:hypothetical protein
MEYWLARAVDRPELEPPWHPPAGRAAVVRETRVRSRRGAPTAVPPPIRGYALLWPAGDMPCYGRPPARARIRVIHSSNTALTFL